MAEEVGMRADEALDRLLQGWGCAVGTVMKLSNLYFWK